MADDDRYARLVAIARSFRGSGTTPTAAEVAQLAGISLSTYHRGVPSHAGLLADAGFSAAPSSRERLLQAAADLLGEVGFTGLQMDDVARRAGVSRGTLYRIFPGRDDLLRGLVDSQTALARLGPILEQVGDTPADEVLPFLVAATAPRLMANRHLLRAILAHPVASNGDEIAGRGPLKQMFTAIGKYLRHQMEIGVLRTTDPTAATIALLGPIYAFVVTQPDLWAEGEPPLDLERMVETSVELWLRGMRPDSEPAP